MAVEGVLPAKRSRSNTRARLLDGAFEVFAERGFQRATIEDVCEAAGFTRGAFYSNFTSLDELFVALWDGQASSLIDALHVFVEHLDCEQGREAHRVGLAEVLASFEAHDRRWFQINADFMAYALRNPKAAALLNAHRAWMREELTRIIDRAPGIDERRRQLGVDPARHTRLVIAAFEGALEQVLLEPELGGRDGLIQQLVALLVGTEPAC
jgi:AcrR family transcriptional regulator